MVVQYGPLLLLATWSAFDHQTFKAMEIQSFAPQEIAEEYLRWRIDRTVTRWADLDTMPMLSIVNG